MQRDDEMLYIQKGKEPQEIIDWKKKFKNVNKHRPNYQDIEHKEEKRILKENLIREQKGLCCYCCASITMDNSHIEHFRPKGLPQYADLSLEYENLHACCMGENQDGKHCGHKKGNQFDEMKMLSPLETDCEERFAFWTDGTIVPAEKNDVKADYTITVLALDDKRLNRARETALWASGVFTAESNEERVELLEKFKTPQNGVLAPYCDAILYHLKKGLESEV